MNGFYLTTGLCLSFLLLVRCDDVEVDSYSMDSDLPELSASVDELGRNPIHARSKRSVDTDACHQLQTQGLPNAQLAINGAWDNSMTAVVAITTAFNDAKKCASWNLFVSVPCGIKAIVEFISSYKANKAELYQFWTEVKGATRNATVDFVDCAKILLARRSNSS